MGSSAKPAGKTSLYGALLRLYPHSFQQQYSTAMEQTFLDMLAAATTPRDRFIVWLRALIDTPLNAVKEHITYRKDFNMNRNIKLLITALGLAIVMVGLGSFWFGNLHARQNVTIQHASAAQLADAMQQDHFYSDYGDTVLLFSARVSAISNQGSSPLVSFATNRSYGLSCQFSSRLTAHVGQTIAVAAPGGSADRQKHGVLLHNCQEN